MTAYIQPSPVNVKGHVKADRLTKENLEDFAHSVHGTIEEGIVTFSIHNWTHRAMAGDWVVIYLPSGDLQIFTDAMFNRIFEKQENTIG